MLKRNYPTGNSKIEKTITFMFRPTQTWCDLPKRNTGVPCHSKPCIMTRLKFGKHCCVTTRPISMTWLKSEEHCCVMTNLYLVIIEI